MRDLVTSVMKVLEIILIALQITTTICRRNKPKEDKELTSSEESIENLLYFRDCKHKQTSTERPSSAAPVMRQRQPECPCPRMCCSMCCECGAGGMGTNGGNSMFARVAPNKMVVGGMNGMTSMGGTGVMNGMGGSGGMGGMDGMDDFMEPMVMPPSHPHQPPPPIRPTVLRTKKKNKMLPMDMSMLPPIGARRGSGFTREHIKKLIAQDDDIKKILKDLVKVTMSKVDMVDGVPVPQPRPRRVRVQRKSEDNKEGGDDVKDEHRD